MASKQSPGASSKNGWGLRLWCSFSCSVKFYFSFYSTSEAVIAKLGTEDPDRDS